MNLGSAVEETDRDSILFFKNDIFFWKCPVTEQVNKSGGTPLPPFFFPLLTRKKQKRHSPFSPDIPPFFFPTHPPHQHPPSPSSQLAAFHFFFFFFVISSQGGFGEGGGKRTLRKGFVLLGYDHPP